MSMTTQRANLPLGGDILRDKHKNKDSHNGDRHHLGARMFKDFFNHLCFLTPKDQIENR